jgi:DNA-binding CsgD family transcriptional regulator
MFVLAFVEGFDLETRKKHQKTWFAALVTEHDNIRLALRWSVDSGQYAVGRRIAAAVGTFWWLHGHFREGAGWFEIFLENDHDQIDDTHWCLMEGAGILHGWQKNTKKAMLYLLAALADADSHQNHTAIARIIGELGWIFWINGMLEQIAWLEGRLSAPLPEADGWDLAYAHLSLGCLHYDAGQLEAAEKALTRSLDYFTDAGEKHGFAFATSKLALIQNEKGDHPDSQRSILEAINTASQALDLHIITFCVDNAVQWAASQLETRKFTEDQHTIKIAQSLGAVDAWRDIFCMSRTPREKIVYEKMASQLRQRLGEQGFLKAWQAGRSMRAEAVLDLLTSLINTRDTQGAENIPAPSEGDRPGILSERELEVIHRIGEGLSNQEIADQLFITERTVRFHVTSIMNKLGASNRTQAVVIANRMGLL